MNEKNEWHDLDWLDSARNIVEWINNREVDERIMLLLRHSHREVIEDHSVQFSTGLTKIGKRTAYKMGKKLPTDSPFQIWFSFVPRCYETAEKISEGLEERGATIIDMDNLPILVAPEFNDEKVWENLQPDGRNVHEFVNRWANGEFDDMIQNFDEYTDNLVAETLDRISQESQPVVHIHVTHDLAIMAIKRVLLKRPLLPEDREPFLGGISLAINSSNTRNYHINETD
ncbi:MAG: hypothetical protein BAJATHORv1_40232 [Candidatus Thorarchaeota archaeon]|nr:MAG: hypothetical protein BAJATHORv1_40232 [Candidatus Thorarchaeota archaeon]